MSSDAVRARILELSDFAVVDAAERWVGRCEERLRPLDEGKSIGGLSPTALRTIARDVRLADRALDRARSIAIARLILLSATADPEYGNDVLILLQDPESDLRAGTALRIGTVAVALLLLSSLSGIEKTTNRGAPLSFPASSEARVIAGTLANPASPDVGEQEDDAVWRLLDWLVSLLNSDQVTALLNAIALGAIVPIGTKLIRLIRGKDGTMYVVFPDGRKVDIPLERQAAFERLIGGTGEHDEGR